MKRGVFLERVNRFVARVRMEDGTERSVHVASSGRMTELLVMGAPVIIVGEGKPGYKTCGQLAMVRLGQTWVSVDTSVPGKLLRRALEEQSLPAFAGYTAVRPEFRYGESRIDFLLTGDGLPPCLLEVKSVTSVLRDADGAPVGRFPDAPTVRGARHLTELAAALREGYRAVVCFVVQRGDAAAFGTWDAIDPNFGQRLREVARAGVEIHAWRMRVSPHQIALGGRLLVRL